MFYLAGVGLAIFLTLLLISKSKKTIADTILAGWLFLVTAHLFLFYCRKINVYPQVLGIEIPFPLVHGPFLYLYTQALTNRSKSLAASLLHFIPATVTTLYIIPFLAMPLDQKIYVYEHQGIGYETFTVIKTVSIIASGILYVVLSIRLLKKHRLSIANQFSNIDKINLQWLQYLIYWIGVIWLLVIFTDDDWVFVAAVFFVVFIGFFGIRQAGVFHARPNEVSEGVNALPENEEKTTDEFHAKRKYQKSGLSGDLSELLHHQLTKVMTDQKLYCESELSLAELAARLNTQPNYLSQVINEREGKNYYDYINTLRIEEFKRVATSEESKKYTLLALAEHCGFNSKSSFNRYFKKVTGQSPSEFMVSTSKSQN